MELNPFIWTGAVKDGVPRGEFARQTARILKGGTHVALFGPRGTGKTTFLGQLRAELARKRGPKAPDWEMVVVDLRRAISLAAFIGAVSDALANHPSQKTRRRAEAAVGRLEKEIGINLGVVKAGVRSVTRSDLNEAEILHGQLAVLVHLADRIVIAFDEFQRLNSCPGEPLSLIRSALMGPDIVGRVSLVLTGSLRERLELMLHSSSEPIWDQTHDLELPDLDRSDLIEFLEQRFHDTQRPIDPHACEDLVAFTDGHPKRSQHLAWHVWEHAKPNSEIGRDDVYAAFDYLLSNDRYTTDFAGLIDNLLSGSDHEINDARALFLLAAGGRPGSQNDAQHYGLTNYNATSRALQRLKARGIILQRKEHWVIGDPLLAEWLRRQDPLAS